MLPGDATGGGATNEVSAVAEACGMHSCGGGTASCIPDACVGETERDKAASARVRFAAGDASKWACGDAGDAATVAAAAAATAASADAGDGAVPCGDSIVIVIARGGEVGGIVRSRDAGSAADAVVERVAASRIRASLSKWEWKAMYSKRFERKT